MMNQTQYHDVLSIESVMLTKEASVIRYFTDVQDDCQIPCSSNKTMIFSKVQNSDLFNLRILDLVIYSTRRTIRINPKSNQSKIN